MKRRMAQTCRARLKSGEVNTEVGPAKGEPKVATEEGTLVETKMKTGFVEAEGSRGDKTCSCRARIGVVPLHWPSPGCLDRPAGSNRSLTREKAEKRAKSSGAGSASFLAALLRYLAIHVSRYRTEQRMPHGKSETDAVFCPVTAHMILHMIVQ